MYPSLSRSSPCRTKHSESSPPRSRRSSAPPPLRSRFKQSMLPHARGARTCLVVLAIVVLPQVAIVQFKVTVWSDGWMDETSLARSRYVQCHYQWYTTRHDQVHCPAGSTRYWDTEVDFITKFYILLIQCHCQWYKTRHDQVNFRCLDSLKSEGFALCSVSSRARVHLAASLTSARLSDLLQESRALGGRQLVSGGEALNGAAVFLRATIAANPLLPR